MKIKTAILSALFAVVCTFGLAAQEFGGGLTFYVPESLYLSGQGSIDQETEFGTSLGFGDMLSLPLGVGFTKSYGLMAVDSAGKHLDTSGVPWFYGDALLAHALIQSRINLPGGLFVEANGGVEGLWLVTAVPFVDKMETYATGSYDGAHLEGLTVKPSLGWGYRAGGALGMKFGSISVVIEAFYRHLAAPVEVSGTLYQRTGTTLSPAASWGSQIAAIAMRGVSISVGGRFAP